MIREYSGVQIVTSPLIPVSRAYLIGHDIVAINMTVTRWQRFKKWVKR